MTTTLDRDETEAELDKVFKKLPIADCQVILKCLQSIASERSDALGRVVDLEAEIARLKRDHVYATGSASVPVPAFPEFPKDTP